MTFRLSSSPVFCLPASYSSHEHRPLAATSTAFSPLLPTFPSNRSQRKVLPMFRWNRSQRKAFMTIKRQHPLMIFLEPPFSHLFLLSLFTDFLKIVGRQNDNLASLNAMCTMQYTQTYNTMYFPNLFAEPSTSVFPTSEPRRPRPHTIEDWTTFQITFKCQTFQIKCQTMKVQ